MKVQVRGQTGEAPSGENTENAFCNC